MVLGMTASDVMRARTRGTKPARGCCRRGFPRAHASSSASPPRSGPGSGLPTLDHASDEQKRSTVRALSSRLTGPAARPGHDARSASGPRRPGGGVNDTSAGTTSSATPKSAWSRPGPCPPVPPFPLPARATTTGVHTIPVTIGSTARSGRPLLAPSRRRPVPTCRQRSFSHSSASRAIQGTATSRSAGHRVTSSREPSMCGLASASAWAGAPRIAVCPSRIYAGNCKSCSKVAISSRRGAALLSGGVAKRRRR